MEDFGYPPKFPQDADESEIAIGENNSTPVEVEIKDKAKGKKVHKQ